MSFFDLSGFTPVPESLLLKYRKSWNLFETVQTNDIQVSTMRSKGESDPSKSYWIFETNEQKTLWLQGQLLHVQRYPTMDWTAPKKS
jgi:hypothetical protein